MVLVPIGRFSEMTRLSIKALRLYDQNGLLTPAHIDESSGYRYYHLGQANRAEAIRVLRSVERPLDEIRATLDADEPELARKYLIAHRERLEDKLASQERMLAYLETLIERKEGIMTYDVQVTEATPQLVAAIKLHTNLKQVGEDIAAGFGAVVHAMGSAGKSPAGAPFIIFPDVIDEQTDGDIEICVPVADAMADDGDVYGREVAGATVATTMHKGPYQQVAAAYHTLTAWISEHGHDMAGPPREIYLNDPQTVPEDELLTRVEWPIVAQQS